MVFVRRRGGVSLETLKDYESGLRSLVYSAHGVEYLPIESFKKAKKVTDACVIFEGDYGGQIYLTCPMKYVRCSEVELLGLLVYIDKMQWNIEDGRRVFYEILPIGSVVAGGMGGGIVADGLWLHKRISAPEIRDYIIDIVCNAHTK